MGAESPRRDCRPVTRFGTGQRAKTPILSRQATGTGVAFGRSMKSLTLACALALPSVLALVACGGQMVPDLPASSGSPIPGATTPAPGGSVVTPPQPPGTKPCGTRGGVQCASGEYCRFEESAQCGAADQGGTCTPVSRNTGCGREWSPVCGCDGITYGNACETVAANVSIMRQGECLSVPPPPPPGSKTCGGFGGATCPSGEYCKYDPNGWCGGDDGGGVCVRKNKGPGACPDVYAPVCGCDGNVYSNDCEADAANVSYMPYANCVDQTESGASSSGSGAP